MSATFIIDEKTGKAYARVLLSSERASTFHSDHIMLDKAAAVAEANSLVRERDGKSLLEKPKKVALQLSEKQTDE